MLEVLTNASLNRLPRIANCKMFLPLRQDLNSKVNIGTGTVIDTGVTKTTSGYKVDTIEGYLALPNDIGIVDSFTISARVKILGEPGNGYHIAFGGVECEISIPEKERSIRVGLRIDGIRHVYNFGANLVPSYEWCLLTFSHSPGIMRAYINAEFVGESEVPLGILNNVHPRRIGNYISGGYYLNGLIKEAAIYNVALTAKEIKELYHYDNMLK